MVRTYLAERFPLPAVGALSLIAATLQWAFFAPADSGVGWSLGVWALLALVFLAGLARYRIVDEHRDAAKDATLYPNRPVPSGLVSLRVLTRIGVVVFLVELAAAAGVAMLGGNPVTLLWYLPFLVFSGLTAVEFFAGRWFARHFTTEFVVHQLAYPLMFLWAGIALGATGPQLAFGTIAVSFAFVAIEVARKFGPRVGGDGAVTRDTYSVMWGRTGAAMVLSLSLTVAAIAAALATGWWLLAVFALPAWIPIFCRSSATRVTVATLAWVLLFAVTAALLGIVA